MELYSLYAIFSSVRDAVWTLSSLYQLVALGLNVTLGKIVSVYLQKWSAHFPPFSRFQDRYRRTIKALFFPILSCLVQWIIVASGRELQKHLWISHAAATFMTGWVLTRFLSLCMPPSTFRKALYFFIYSVATLHVTKFLSHVIAIVDSFALDVGELRISVLSFLKGGVLLFFSLWGASALSKWASSKLKALTRIEPAFRELLIKLIRVSFIAFSTLIALSSMGLNLSAFALFGGAIGVGIGFGLQKVISNLICGMILLIDRSIKPGDVIALKQGTSYGIIHKLGARYVSVRTRSGKEHLIPNEDFIIHPSENWSLTDRYLRLHLPIRAALDSDVPLVMNLLIEATKNIARIAKDRPPSARLRGFGESAIEFELRIWIHDPQNGLSKVKSDVYIQLWSLFKKHRISIPYPQRTVHVATPIEGDFSVSPGREKGILPGLCK